ncbi:MAG: CsgG/HfaB family protein [Leptospiraceae bacterium]|nr:CsgG/HfaB family protein [Leptospiraceae bacterium]
MKFVTQRKNILYFFLILLLFCTSGEKERPVYFINPNPPTSFEKIAISLASKENNPQQKKLIVLNFTTVDGKEHLLGKIFAEKLTTELSKLGKFIVLDRMVYSKKLSESGLSLAGNLEPNYLKKLGETLGIEHVIVGIVLPSKSSGYDLNCRLIEIKTGLILAAEESYYESEN